MIFFVSSLKLQLIMLLRSASEDISPWGIINYLAIFLCAYIYSSPASLKLYYLANFMLSRTIIPLPIISAKLNFGLSTSFAFLSLLVLFCTSWFAASMFYFWAYSALIFWKSGLIGSSLGSTFVGSLPTWWRYFKAMELKLFFIYSLSISWLFLSCTMGSLSDWTDSPPLY